MSKILTFGGFALTVGNHAVGASAVNPTPVLTPHTITLQNDGHGTIAASKPSAFSGEQITLSNTPATNYQFSGYTITGATLTGNVFNMPDNNVTAKAWFKAATPHNVNVKIRDYWTTAAWGGTATATPSSAPAGTTIQLRATPMDEYEFHSYVIHGLTEGEYVSENQNFSFTMPDNDVNLSAVFIHW